MDRMRLDRGYVVRRGAEWLHTSDGNDVSPAWDMYHGYVPACGWCWLGAAHTADEHARRLS